MECGMWLQVDAADSRARQRGPVGVSARSDFDPGWGISDSLSLIEHDLTAQSPDIGIKPLCRISV
jgi:hypothetical protein